MEIHSRVELQKGRIPNMTLPLEETCRRFEKGGLNLDSEDDVRLLLQGEGLKRLESFIFELLMQRALAKYCSDFPTAYGWYVLPLDKKEAGLWISFQTETVPGACDEALLALLKRRLCSVLKVRLSDGKAGFRACWNSEKGWGEECDLAALLQQRFGSPRNISQPTPAPRERADLLFAALFKRMTAPERRSLALSRILINGFLVPYIKSQPMDLDAVILNDRQVLKFVEFKRKYPTRGMKFGLDTYPHVALIEWLYGTGHTLSNIILVDPSRNKEISPLHLLDEPTRKHTRWIGAHLDPSCFERNSLSTTGTDSGMYSYGRQQRAVGVERYMDLGTGFSPGRLKAFLNDELLPHTSANQLNQDTDALSR
jgi:hypothetical protein